MTRPPRELVVLDREEPCPYRTGQVARTPLRWQTAPLSPVGVDESLQAGDRRIGRMLYRPSCRFCSACEAIRVPVERFRASRSQRRLWRRNRDVDIEVGPADLTEERLRLFNRHKLERGLARDDGAMSAESYAAWFLDTCQPTVEMRYRVGGRLIGVGLVDLGQRDASSVYFYFDPDESRRSLGTFSILAEIAWLRAREGRYHYLGLHVTDCRSLSYKAKFRPHQRLIDGEWRSFPVE